SSTCSRPCWKILSSIPGSHGRGICSSVKTDSFNGVVLLLRRPIITGADRNVFRETGRPPRNGCVPCPDLRLKLAHHPIVKLAHRAQRVAADQFASGHHPLDAQILELVDGVHIERTDADGYVQPPGTLVAAFDLPQALDLLA